MLESGTKKVFAGLRSEHYGTILADPAWPFRTWSAKGRGRSPDKHYSEMTVKEIMALPVEELVTSDAVLFLWITGPQVEVGLDVIRAWRFTFKTVGFVWVKTGGKFGLGYWTRTGAELCLLATRGFPKRLHADVPQVILEPRREHSRKPDCVHERIERLVSGPYLELFARSRRDGWDCWGNELDKF